MGHPTRSNFRNLFWTTVAVITLGALGVLRSQHSISPVALPLPHIEAGPANEEAGPRGWGHPTQQLRTAMQYLEAAAAQQSSAYPQHCDRRYQGLQHVQGLRESMQPVCLPQPDATHPSLLLCSFQRDETYHIPTGLPEAFCAASNMALDIRTLQAYTQGLGGDPGREEEAGAPGLVLGNCSMQAVQSAGGSGGGLGAVLGALRAAHPMAEESSWQARNVGKGGQEWVHRSFQEVAPGAQPPNCITWVHHPLYFLADRYDSRNVWHGLEDITHAFETYAMMGWGPEAQIVVLDAPPHRPAWEGFSYAPVWAKAFSTLKPPTTLHQLAADSVGGVGGELPPGAAICFKEGSWNVHGGLSILSRGNDQDTPCVNSTMINAMVGFILDRLNMSQELPPSHSAAHAERAGAVARAEGAEGWGQQQAGRRIPRGRAAGKGGGGRQPGTRQRVLWALRSDRAPDQDRIVQVVRQGLQREGVELEAVELGRLGIQEQLRLVRGADVLAGFHGAALTLSMFMPPESGLVEIEVLYRCHCYANAAAWRGRPYLKLQHRPEPEFAEHVLWEVLAALAMVRQRLGLGSGG